MIGDPPSSSRLLLIGPLFLDTLRALLAPRRLVPILLVCVPMVLAQRRFSSSGQAVWVAVGMCLLFLALGPFVWRALFPPEPPRSRIVVRLLRLLCYGLLGALPALFGWIFPELLQLGESFLTAGVNLLISAALFWVGGWGLARDIELEQGLARERRRAEELAREAERSQLLALRTHLDPHFLFNTLNAIAEWCREDGAVAERALLDLSAMLRRILSGVREEVWPLEQELELVRGLWDLHRVRDPQRFELRWEVRGPTAGLVIPPLLLLPLAENAVKHGPARGHRGILSLELQRERERAPAGALVIRITNPGPFAPGARNGEGLAMVRRRLELTWPGQARLELRTCPGEHGGESTVAELRLPAQEGGTASSARPVQQDSVQRSR